MGLIDRCDDFAIQLTQICISARKPPSSLRFLAALLNRAKV